MKITATIKASSISTFFPDRYKSIIGEWSLLEFIVRRLRQSKYINGIVLSTTKDRIDDELVDMAEKLDIKYHRGDYEDAIGRIYGSASIGNSDIIVKVMGHYPLVEPIETDKIIEEFMASDYSYAHNEHYDGIVLGLGVEVFTFELIERANREITSQVKRRFGTNLFKETVSKDKILAPAYDLSRPNYRVTLAVPEDSEILNQIVEKSEDLSYKGIVKYLDDNPIISKYAQQNLSTSNEVGVEKILLFPEKIKSIHACTNGEIDYSYPVSVELSLTNKCNLACKWCSDNDLRKRSMVDIDPNAVEDLLKDLAKHGTRGVVLEGGGEPTIYKSFGNVIESAKKHGLSLGLITNGVDLNYEDKLDHFDWIRISLDAANREQFLHAKGRDKFDIVIDNIRKITNYRKNGNLVVGVGYVTTNVNEHSIEELLINLRKINVNYVQIRPVIDHAEMLPHNLDLEYLRKYATTDFSINVHNMSENIVKGNFNLPCCSHSLSSVITANGDVFLCGRLNIYDWMKPIGNITESSFHDIWHGEERIRQVNMVLDSGFCRKWCPECRLTKYNVVFENTSAIKTGDFI